MPRIRTVKPEYWEDEVIGCLPRDARLLFIATWNLADDEGRLRWSAPYLKASAFMFDDDLSVDDVEALMACLTDAGLVRTYRAGKANQLLAVVVNFLRHQKVNRPLPSKLPPPPDGLTELSLSPSLKLSWPIQWRKWKWKGKWKGIRKKKQQEGTLTGARRNRWPRLSTGHPLRPL